jgi:hypothetical protein
MHTVDLAHFVAAVCEEAEGVRAELGRSGEDGQDYCVVEIVGDKASFHKVIEWAKEARGDSTIYQASSTSRTKFIHTK